MKTVEDIESKPVRGCRTVHKCRLCTFDIEVGEFYHDGGYGKRVHTLCLKWIPHREIESILAGKESEYYVRPKRLICDSCGNPIKWEEFSYKEGLNVCGMCSGDLKRFEDDKTRAEREIKAVIRWLKGGNKPHFEDFDGFPDGYTNSSVYPTYAADVLEWVLENYKVEVI